MPAPTITQRALAGGAEEEAVIRSDISLREEHVTDPVLEGGDVLAHELGGARAVPRDHRFEHLPMRPDSGGDVRPREGDHPDPERMGVVLLERLEEERVV